MPLERQGETPRAIDLPATAGRAGLALLGESQTLDGRSR
jgi:hypothetical protein